MDLMDELQKTRDGAAGSSTNKAAGSLTGKKNYKKYKKAKTKDKKKKKKSSARSSKNKKAKTTQDKKKKTSSARSSMDKKAKTEDATDEDKGVYSVDLRLQDRRGAMIEMALDGRCRAFTRAGEELGA